MRRLVLAGGCALALAGCSPDERSVDYFTRVARLADRVTDAYDHAEHSCSPNFATHRCYVAVDRYRRVTGRAKTRVASLSPPEGAGEAHGTILRAVRTAHSAARHALAAVPDGDVGAWWRAVDENRQARDYFVSGLEELR